MTKFAQINARIKTIVDAAKESYTRFDKTLGAEKKFKSSLDVLARFRNFNINYTPLKDILDKENLFPDKDLEELIKLLPQEKKAEALILLKKILQSLSTAEKEFNKLLHKMQDMEKLYTDKGYILTQDINKFTRLLEKISKLNPPANILLQNNKELDNVYKEMSTSFQKLQNLYKNSTDLLKNTGSHKNAFRFLHSALQQYEKYVTEYNNLVLKQEEFSKNMSQEKDVLSQLSINLTSIMDKLAKAGINVHDYKSELEKFHKQFAVNTTSINSSMQPVILSNIKTTNEYIQKTIRKMHAKYQKTLSKYIQDIENKANDISRVLEQTSKKITSAKQYISTDLYNQIEKEYLDYQQKVLHILHNNINSTDLPSVLSAVKVIDGLKNEINEWKFDIEKNVHGNILASLKKLKQNFISNKKKLQDEIDKNYTKYSSELASIKVPNIEQNMSVEDLENIRNQLYETQGTMQDINLRYKSIKSSVDMVLDGFNKKKGAEFLQAYLNIPHKNSETIGEVLYIVMQNCHHNDFLAALAEVKFSTLPYSTIQQIESFINTNLNDELNISNISYIKEKLYYYKQFDSLNERDKYISAIDNHALIQALEFLGSKNIAPTQAFNLINNDEDKISVILSLKKHCNEHTDSNHAITAQEIENILSSKTKIASAKVIFRSLKWSENDDASYKNSVYKILMQAIIEDEQFAENVINIAANNELFTPNFLLYLSEYDKTLNSYSQSINFLKEKLNSTHSGAYQVIIQNILQPNKYIDSSFEEFSAHANNIIPKICAHLKDNTNRSIDIRQLPIVFKAVDDLFNTLQSQGNANDETFSQRLELTKKLIFYEFLSDNSWENCVKNSIKVIEKNFADNPSFLEKIINGFKTLIEKISNLFSDNRTVKKEILDSRTITSRFREEITKTKTEDDNSNTHSI